MSQKYRPRDEFIRTEVIHGDVIDKTGMAFLFAVQGDTETTIWIPLSVLVDPPPDELKLQDDIDLEVKQWWFYEHKDELDEA